MFLGHLYRPKYKRRKNMSLDVFDFPTSDFLGAVCTNMPTVSGPEMRGLIDSPDKLEKLLKEAFSPENIRLFLDKK